MKLIYPMLTTASLLLVSSPAMASPMAIAASIDWAKVAIVGGLAVFVIAAGALTVWLSFVLPPELKPLPSFILVGLLTQALVLFIYFSR